MFYSSLIYIAFPRPFAASMFYYKRHHIGKVFWKYQLTVEYDY